MTGKRQLTIYADGGARGNPGPAAVGFVVLDQDKKVLDRCKRKIGRATNNVAEYQAVIDALRWLADKRPETVSSVRLFLDSQLVVNQLNGIYKIKNSGLRNLIVRVRQQERRLDTPVTYHHVSREKNRIADRLVNLALDQKGA
jgi:ribonuclease HI